VAKGIPFPAGYCHCPRYSEEYFKQITAEQLVTKIVKGYRRHEWQKMRERNEALDCRVYARAAAGRVGIDRFQEKHWTDLERRVGAPPVQDVKQPPQQQRTDGRQTARNRVRFRMDL
jgi:phage terminase large subunit GpA-like protein